MDSANVDATNKFRNTASISASLRGHFEIVIYNSNIRIKKYFFILSIVLVYKISKFN